MLLFFSTPELIRNLWPLKTAVFLHWCLICAVPLVLKVKGFADGQCLRLPIIAKGLFSRIRDSYRFGPVLNRFRMDRLTE